jgi:hypothetical protein
MDPSSHASIDSILKDLKSCSRRLQVVFSAYHDELQILQRLYYKGKNQHRPALFWKRAAEMKRYGERLDCTGLPGAFELLRCSFFGAISIQNAKSMRGSWTHVPNSTYATFVVGRLDDCLKLVDKIHERLVEIYRSFRLAMQSGAFIQLILTLAAIAARMDALIPEFQDALQIAWKTGHRFLQVLDPKQAQKMKPIHAEKRDSQRPSTAAEMDLHTPLNIPSLEDDIGSSVARDPCASLSSNYAVDVTSNPVSSIVDDDTVVVSGEVLELLTTAGQAEPVRRVIVERPVSAEKVSKRSQQSHEAGAAQPGKKAKRKKRNEIDDIFGF